ncbi:MAG TPA: DUF167 domain-containing protein [Allosphingosinicella sp.]|jgi:uncharacterized protein (TIGR00251 family)
MPIAADGKDVRLAIKVSPRASKTALAGQIEDADGRKRIAIRLAAPPVDGAANKALIAFLAAELRVPRSSITILSGDSGRRKTVAIAGITHEAVARWLESAVD